MHLKELVRRHRKLTRLSQAELARLAGVGKTVIYDIEAGKRSIRFDTLEKVLGVLNIKISFESPLGAATEGGEREDER